MHRQRHHRGRQGGEAGVWVAGQWEGERERQKTRGEAVSKVRKRTNRGLGGRVGGRGRGKRKGNMLRRSCDGGRMGGGIWGDGRLAC